MNSIAINYSHIWSKTRSYWFHYRSAELYLLYYWCTRFFFLNLYKKHVRFSSIISYYVQLWMKKQYVANTENKNASSIKSDTVLIYQIQYLIYLLRKLLLCSALFIIRVTRWHKYTTKHHNILHCISILVSSIHCRR